MTGDPQNTTEPNVIGSPAETPLTTDNPLLSELFATMVEIRQTEEALLDLFSQGVLRGTVHTCIGQEATAVGVVSALDPDRDIVCSNHRGHGHFLAFCHDVRGLIAEIMGLAEGVCGGIGGSQHLHVKNFYTNGILGGMVPVATGMALAEKKKNSNAVVVVFLGDGAFGEGVVYESMNMAALWGLPIIYAVEQNGYAQSTPYQLEHAGNLADRGRAFGIPVTELDGNDIAAVRAAADQAVAEVRTQQRPQVLFMNTYRLAAHSKGDDLRDPEEIAFQRRQAPISRCRALLSENWCDECAEQTEQRVRSIVDELMSIRNQHASGS